MQCDTPKNRRVVFVMLLLTFIHTAFFSLLDSENKEAHL